MTDQHFDYLEFELPEGWEQVELPGGPLFQAFAPEGEGFRTSVVADIYPDFSDVEGPEAHRDFHIGQIESLARTMTDALLVDDADVTVAHLPAITSTIAFRQGFWTVTARVWTIQVSTAAVMITGLCDVDHLPLDGPAFEEIVQSIVITPSGAGSHV